MRMRCGVVVTIQVSLHTDWMAIHLVINFCCLCKYHKETLLSSQIRVNWWVNHINILIVAHRADSGYFANTLLFVLSRTKESLIFLMHAWDEMWRKRCIKNLVHKTTTETNTKNLQNRHNEIPCFCIKLICEMDKSQQLMQKKIFCYASTISHWSEL